MSQFRVAIVAASALTLAACAGGPDWVQGFQLPNSQPQPIALEILSEPSGAEARAASGESCTTPCTLTLPPADVAVTFTHQGFEPETIMVQAIQPEREYGTAPRPPRFEPSAIRAELRPVPRRARPAARTTKPQPSATPASAPASTAKPVTTSKPKPAPVPEPPAPPPPAPASPWPPVPGSQ